MTWNAIYFLPTKQQAITSKKVLSTVGRSTAIGGRQTLHYSLPCRVCRLHIWSRTRDYAAIANRVTAATEGEMVRRYDRTLAEREEQRLAAVHHEARAAPPVSTIGFRFVDGCRARFIFPRSACGHPRAIRRGV